jgi:peptide/nickel transport system ATP-binding protein
MNPTIASIRSLSVQFPTKKGTVQALRGVDLELKRGEIVALVGESGSGKSVLSSCLLGMPGQRASVSGEVTVGGVDMLNGAESQRRSVRRHLLGAVFQDPLGALDPTMRVGRLLGERGLRGAKAEAVLRDVAVPDVSRRLRQWPHQLSGGLRQRVAIGFALGADGRLPEDAGGDHTSHVETLAGSGNAPLLLIADEPTTALDVSVQAQVLSLFDRLRREHSCALLLVTHDLAAAASVADSVVVMYAGRVCETGPIADVIARPAHPYTASLLAARLPLSDESPNPVPMRGSPPNPSDLPPGCAFAPRCDHATDSCTMAIPEPVPVSVNGRVEPLRTVACIHNGALLAAVASPAPLSARTTPTRHAADEPVLTIDSASKSFPVPGDRKQRLHAVSEVSLELQGGQSLAVVGESGCGKTTLLRLACGLTTPDHGTVRWGESGPPQLVFQDAGASLTPWFSVGRQVTERLRARGLDTTTSRQRAGELFELVGLDSRAAQVLPRQLSGGQRQRAAIARALASEPRLLVCDEPISALDASLSVRILDLLHDIRRELGVALLFVTHDLAAARYIADDVAVMYLGRVVEQAPADTLFSNPRHPYSAGLLAASPAAHSGALAPTLEGEPPSPIGEHVGCAFASRCPAVHDRCRTDRPLLVRRSGAMLACHLDEPDGYLG